MIQSKHYEHGYLVHIFRIFCVALFILLLTGCEQATPLRQTDTAAHTIAELEKKLPRLMRRNKISGIGIAVIRNSEIAFVKSFGVVKSGGTTSINSSTIFEVASLGKPVFAYITAKLADEGLLDLDTPLVKYVPNLFAPQLPEHQTITARMVLSHSSGLPNFGKKHPEKLSFSPGTAYTYSGIGFEKLQHVLEKVSGASLNQLAQRIVFEPFDMKSTSYIWQNKFQLRFANGHNKQGKVVAQRRKPQKGHAAWSLYSTTADYAKFVARLMNKADPIASMMYRPQIKITDKISWGIGWSLQNTTPHISFWHWGSNPGYRSYIVGYPHEGIAVIVLSNSDTMFKAIKDIVRITIGGALPSYHWF